MILVSVGKIDIVANDNDLTISLLEVPNRKYVGDKPNFVNQYPDLESFLVGFHKLIDSSLDVYFSQNNTK